jgi:hypothetical protein
MEPSSTKTSLYDRKFQVALGTIGAVAAVIWASQTGRKGKFWWWCGGSMIGGSIGYLLDSATSKK